MKIQISPDARPQVRTLLLATLITLALWFIPYLEYLTYPFRIFVTFIHEGGHALAALLMGGSVMSLSVHTDASGLTLATYEGLFSQFIVSSAGYVGATAFGALLLFLIRRAIAARIVLTGSAVFILLMTFIFGLWMPMYFRDANVQFSGIPFTVAAGVVLSVALLALARYASARVATFFVSFLAVQCVLNAVLDLKTLLFISSPFGPEIHSDAQNMYNATHIPAMFWAILWIGISLALVSMAMRFYAVSKHPPKQQDLPFDEPLDI